METQLEAELEHGGRISRGVLIANLAAVIVPFLALFAAAIFLWGWGFSWVDLGLLLGMYFATAVGITVGYHRLFTHRSFEAASPVRFTLSVLGSMAVQGPLLQWVAMHRWHHRYSDRPEDPHTPHHHGRGILGVFKGLWHAHVGWIFQTDPDGLENYNQDLRHSAMLRAVSALFPLWVVLGLLIPAVLGGVISLSWAGVWTGLIWGGFVRIFAVHHVTWSVNSVCHVWGRKTFRGTDESRDNFLFGVLALGEGWHHSHHTFPTSARHGLRWWQLDISYLVIRTLALLGLAWKVKLPSPEAESAKRLAA